VSEPRCVLYGIFNFFKKTQYSSVRCIVNARRLWCHFRDGLPEDARYFKGLTMVDILPVPETPEVPTTVVDEAIPTTVVDSTPAPSELAVSQPSLRESLADVFDIPEGVSDEDFKNQMLSWYERSNQIGDNEDINQLRQAAAQYQQIAPQLTAFQQWQQAQQAAPPAPTPVDEWAMPEISATERALIKVSDNGRFIPTELADPVAVAAAAKANQRAAIQESIANLATTNPREYAKRAMQAELDRRDAAILEMINAFQQQVAPIQQYQQQVSAQAEFDAFVDANSSLLLKPSADGYGHVWTDAAGTFSKEYEGMVSRGVDPVVARDYALRLAAATAPVAPAAPAATKAPAPQRAATRAIEVAKARIPQVAGAATVPTGRARTLSQLVDVKSREFAATSGQ
jgi:hypothetical protein